MGIFGKDSPQQGTGNGSTVIAAGTKLVGDLTLNDSLHIDGCIEGDVQSESDVALGKSGTLNGQIKARRVLVSGTVTGRIEAERLEIVAGGTVEGDVSIVDLVIETGGRFNGSSEIRSGTPEPASTSDRRADRSRSKSEAANVEASVPGESTPII